jgi:predicted AlkP superfamily pyrophosphatase or phosphodiesterase
MADMQSRLGPFMAGNDPGPPGDVVKTRYALDILRKLKPQFMTIHLSALDELEHEHGPFSPEADAELEVLDADLSELFAAARANDPQAVAIVVSDHGFTTITHRINLLPPFIRAGLVEVAGGAAGAADPHAHGATITSWKAQPWSGGGMAAIMLHQPIAAGTEPEVRKLLLSLKADERNGIDAILDAAQIKQRGGFAGATFLVVMKLGYYVLAEPDGDVVNDVHGTPGSHGFSPEFAEMRASFFATGPGIAQHRDLGLIDMRRIAPTVARLLHVQLADASLPPLDLGQ